MFKKKLKLVKNEAKQIFKKKILQNKFKVDNFNLLNLKVIILNELYKIMINIRFKIFFNFKEKNN